MVKIVSTLLLVGTVDCSCNIVLYCVFNSNSVLVIRKGLLFLGITGKFENDSG